MCVLRSAWPAWWRCQNGYRQLLWIYPRRCRSVQVGGCGIRGWLGSCVLHNVSVVERWLVYMLYVHINIKACYCPLIPLFALGEGAVVPGATVGPSPQFRRKTTEINVKHCRSTPDRGRTHGSLHGGRASKYGTAPLCVTLLDFIIRTNWNSYLVGKYNLPVTARLNTRYPKTCISCESAGLL